MILPLQCRAARAVLKWSLKDLSAKSGVGVATINRFEQSDGTKANASTMAAMQHAMEAAGVLFIPANGGGAGVRLRNP